MSKKISKKSVYIIALTLVVVLVMAISNRIVNADGEELTIDNGDVITIIDNENVIDISGTAPNAEKIAYSFEPAADKYSYDAVKAIENKVVVTEGAFSIDKLDVSSQNKIYIYAYSDSDYRVFGMKEIDINRPKPAVSANDVIIYKDTENVSITGNVINTKKAEVVICLEDKLAEGKKTWSLTDGGDVANSPVDNDDNGSFELEIEINDTNRITKTYYIYALDTDMILTECYEVNVKYEHPSFEFDHNQVKDGAITVEINKDKRNTEEKIKINTKDCPNDKFRIAYSFTEYSEEDVDYSRLDSNSQKAYSGYNSLSVNMVDHEYSCDGESVFVYLYKNDETGQKVFEHEKVIIKREKMDIDQDGSEIEMSVMGKGNKEGNLIVLEEKQNKLTMQIKLYADGYQVNRDNGYYGLSNNPYILEIENNTSKEKRQVSFYYISAEDRNYDYVRGKFYYKVEYQIDNLKNIAEDGNEYSARLLYKTENNTIIDLGNDYNFKIVPGRPSIVWEGYDAENMNQNKKMVMPRYGKDQTLSARIFCAEDDDYIFWSTSDVTDSSDIIDLYNGEGKNTRKNIINNNDIRTVEFDANDFACDTDDYKCYFYLVREVEASKKKGFCLGEYTIHYNNPENNWDSIKNDETNLFKIDDKYYCFVDADNKGNGKADLSGYFINGLNGDEVIWTNQNFSIDELAEWVETEGIKGISTKIDTPDNQNYRNNYSVKMDGLSVKDNEEVINLYVKRNIIGEQIKYYDLGSLIVKEAKKPELTDLQSEENQKFYLGWPNTEYTIFVKAIDYNTGIKEIELCYTNRNNQQTSNTKYFNVGQLKPNQDMNDSIKFEINDLSYTNKEMTLKIRNFNGQEAVYENVFASKPTLEVKPQRELETLGKDDYYVVSSMEEKFVISAKKDEDSSANTYLKAKGLKSIIIRVQDSNSVDIGFFKREYPEAENEAKASDDIVLSLSEMIQEKAGDNKYNVKVEVKNYLKGSDNNNRVEYSFVVEVDDSKPEIQKVSINGKDMPLATENPKYVYITNKNIDVDIDVKDEGVSGLKNVYYFWKNVDGTASPETVEKIEKNTNDVVKVKASVKNSIKSQLFVDAEDVVGNRLDKYLTTGGIIVDLPENHNAENHINISLAETGMKDANGNPLYNSATTATISVSDYYSGISSVEWRVTAPFDANGNKGGSLNINDGYMSDNQWKKVSTDSNLVTEVSNQITIDCNSDDIVLNVKITDNAGNTSEKSVKLSIDKVKPTISVTYNNQTGDPDFNNYYSESRVATIVVKERNFNSDSANSILSNSVGQKGTVSAWKENKDAANPDNTTYTATVTFDKDDRYLVSYQCSDRAGNTSDVITTPEFVIDTVNPEVSVTYNNTTSKNGYYNVDRSVTISVKDVNFDAGRVYINGINAQEYTISNWTRKDNVYQALMTISKDGKYSFDISAKDKAGNTSNSIHTPEFTIDLEAPEIIIEGVKDKSSNKESVAPVISVSDTNIDKASIAIKLEGANRGRIEIEDMYSVSEDGLNFKFKDIERLKENDDLYTLSVTASDLAGNKAENKITFSVNRFGSIYILGDKLKQINDKYVKAAKGLDITEINVDELDVNNLIITLAVNGVSSTLKEGTDYSVNLKLGNTDWKEYTYSFNDNLFTKDGSYILTLVSEDAAGNVNNSSDEDKEAEVKFGVDATAPIVSALNFEDNHYYGQNETQFMVAVKDNMILDSVSILVNGNQVAYAEDDEVYTFNVEGSNRRQDIKVVAKDAAGNETILNVGGVLVNGGFFARLIHNKIAMLIILSSLVAIAIALPLILVLAARRRR